ncbi:hypothetical protein [Acidovorax sp. 69]|uniref:amino acid kinase family protein n=1 Tax=Acidovorax sp. 69 TaxID=2035202 RepID=UPI0026B8F38C
MDSSFQKNSNGMDRSQIRQNVDVIDTDFHGIDDDSNITTLGGGGSDTSAVVAAAAMKAHGCLIYTDVDDVTASSASA